MPKQPTTFSSNSKKYNIVIYGIKEHPVGTPKLGDLQEIIDTFSKVDKSVPPQSIKDHYRLGKFKQSLHRPRPILVTLNSTTDVYSLLSKRSVAKPPLLIKPDLSRQERSFESLLLSERWSLLQSGIDSKSIKIRHNKFILVNNKLHAKIIDNKLIRSTDTSVSNLPLESSVSSNLLPDSDSDPPQSSLISILPSNSTFVSTSPSSTPGTAPVSSCPQGSD